MVVKLLLFYIQFVDWSFTSLNIYVVTFYLNFLASKILAIWQEVITLFGCEIIVTLNQVYWFFCTCFDLYVVSIHLNYCSGYNIGFLTRSNYFVWLWIHFYFISSSLIEPFLAQIWMLLLLIDLFEGGKILAFSQELITLYGW